ncbi:hypothetical protein B0H10DRAFT_2303529 [Mycena sp. CBHHK59/15]|nr:hypothetical protein B0H10DRAFT_2303529 [Mycena sp. CBHHK59/15]
MKKPPWTFQMSIEDISTALCLYPGLNYLNFHGLTQFLRMVCLARPTIEFQQIDKRRPPSALPLGMLEMLAASLQVSNTPWWRLAGLHSKKLFGITHWFHQQTTK